MAGLTADEALGIRIISCGEAAAVLRRRGDALQKGAGLQDSPRAGSTLALHLWISCSVEPQR